MTHLVNGCGVLATVAPFFCDRPKILQDCPPECLAFASPGQSATLVIPSPYHSSDDRFLLGNLWKNLRSESVSRGIGDFASNRLVQYFRKVVPLEGFRVGRSVEHER